MLLNPHNLLPTSLLALLMVPSLPSSFNYGLGVAAMMTNMITTPPTPTTTAAATLSPNDPFRAVILKSPLPPEPPMCCLKRSGSGLDLEGVEEGMLLSFEEWKARHEKDRAAGLAGAAGVSASASVSANGSAYSTAYPNKSASATGTVGSPSGHAAMGSGGAEAGLGGSHSVSNESGDTGIPNVTGSGTDAGGISNSGDITSTSPTSSEDPMDADDSHYYYLHQQELSPHFMVPLTDRFDYANLDCSARVHSSHKSAKSPSSILSSKRDRYMLSPCRAKGKDGKSEKQFVVVELCEDIRIDTVQLANFEFFSGVFKDFEVSVAKTYTTNPEDWTPAGTYKAKNVRGVQSFHPPISLRDFYRYIRIDFRSYYGTEYYCPISLLRVYGLTHLEEWKWEMWETESRARRDEQAAQLAAAAAAASAAASYYYASQRHHPPPHSLTDEGAASSYPVPGQLPTIVQGDKSPELPPPHNIAVAGKVPTAFVEPTAGLNNSPVPSGTLSSSLTVGVPGSDSSHIRSEGSNIVLTDGIFVTVAPSYSSSSPTPISPDIPHSSSSESSIHSTSSSHHRQKDVNDNNESVVTSNLTNPPHAQVTTTLTTTPAAAASTLEDGHRQAEGGNSMNNDDFTTSSTGSTSSSSSSGSSGSVSSSHGVVHNDNAVPIASSESVMSAEGDRIPVHARTPSSLVHQQRHAGSSSSSSSSQVSQASSSSSPPTAISVPPPPPPPPPSSQPPPSYWATGGESIYRTIMNRLSALETNHTLYVRYIEQQTNGVREVLKRLTEEVGRIEGMGRANSITQQRSVQEWDRQRYQIQREYRELRDRVEYLADEINLEKRLSIAQLCLLAAVLVFMGLTRGYRGSNGSNEALARQEQARTQAPNRYTKGSKTVKGRGPRFLSFSGDWMSKSKSGPQVEGKGKEKEGAVGVPAQEGVGDEKVAFPSTDSDPSEERDDSESTPYLSSDERTVMNIAHPIQTRRRKSKSNGSSHSRSRTPSIRHAAMSGSGSSSGTTTATSRYPHFQRPVTPTSSSSSSKSARLPRSDSMHGAIYLSPGPIPPVGYGVYSHHPHAQYYYPLAHHGHGQGHNYVIMGRGFSPGPGPRSAKKWARTAHLHELRVTPGGGSASARARVVASPSAGSVGASKKNVKDERGDGDVFSDSSVLPASLGKKVMVLDARTSSPRRGQKHQQQQRQKKNSHLPSPSPSQASVSVLSESEDEGQAGEQGKKGKDVRWARTGGEEDGQWIDTDSDGYSEGDTESCSDADLDGDGGYEAPALLD